MCLRSRCVGRIYILTKQLCTLLDNVIAAEFLEECLLSCWRLLLQHMDLVWCGHAEAAAKPQDAEAVTHAAKVRLSWCTPFHCTLMGEIGRD